MGKHIKISILNSPGEYINYSVRSIDCLKMKPGEHISTESLIAFCGLCDEMQECRPWTKVDDISREEFEAIANDGNELLKRLGL